MINWKKFLFWGLLVICVITYFTKDNYRNVSNIRPEVLNEPQQTGADDKDTITFTRNDLSTSSLRFLIMS